MAKSGEVEAEYESEPEESVLLRRRSEASDDDEQVEDEGNKRAIYGRLNRSVWRSGCTDESDGREGAPEYYNDDDNNDYDDDGEVSYIDELEKLGEQVEEELEEEVAEKVEEEREEEVAEQVTTTKQRGKEKVNVGDSDAVAVPRTGAYYMHDDRFGGVRRRSRDQRRKKIIWESKDELKWMHDKFEEMKLEDKELNAFEVHRTSNDYHQGRNKNNTKSGGYKEKESMLHSNSGNYGSSIKMVKGRGPVRYKSLSRSISAHPPRKSIQLEKIQGTSPKTDSAKIVSANNNQQYKRSLGKTANDDSERALSTKCKLPVNPFKKTGDTDSSMETNNKQSRDQGMASHSAPASVSYHGLNVDCDSVPSLQHLSSPSMSSYLQGFFAESSFHHHNSETQKSSVRPESRNAVFPASVLLNHIIRVPQANDFLHGNIALDIPYPKVGVGAAAENFSSQLSFQYSVPGSICMASPESRDQRTIPFTHQATPFPNQLNRVSSLAQPIVQQGPVDSTIQPRLQDFTRQLHSCLQSGSRRLREASSVSFHEPGIFESLEGSIQLKVASLGTGSNITSPQYTGIPGDQNFSATSIPYPVMNIGGLHHGTLGDPAVDMTSTGYIGESQVHLRNPNLTWLPILPAAAGAVGATCQPPYAAPDGSSYVNFSTTPIVDIASYATHTSIPSNEAGASRPSNDSLPSLETDHVKKTAEQMNNECGIRQFRPTRYSRMNMKE